tara:strand:+ start:21 stop:626 length:606 start_codon:yes stop_codon:yes gene_type:complete
MVDTLAPKKVFTQRELNTKLTPVSEQVLRTKPRPSLLDDRPKVVGTATSLIDEQSRDFLLDSAMPMTKVATAEQKQTAKSSEETIEEKQTGMRAEREVPQGLGARPGIMYASVGAQDITIDRPLVVGERGPEMIVPVGKNKFTVLSTDDLRGLMARVDIRPKLSEEEEMEQRKKFYDLGRDDQMSLDQYLGSAQAIRDTKD